MSATLNDGQLGNWVKMSLSPRMNFTVEQNQIKVTEENYPDAGYRVTGPLETRTYKSVNLQYCASPAQPQRHHAPVPPQIGNP